MGGPDGPNWCGHVRPPAWTCVLYGPDRFRSGAAGGLRETSCAGIVRRAQHSRCGLVPSSVPTTRMVFNALIARWRVVHGRSCGVVTAIDPPSSSAGQRVTTPREAAANVLVSDPVIGAVLGQAT